MLAEAVFSVSKTQANVLSVIMKMPKKMGLIAVCGGKFEWSFDSINAHFDSLSRYLGWKDIGRSEARGYPTKTDIQKTEYPKLAYQFGFNLS